MKFLVVIPSNQDRNIGLGGYVESAGMSDLARAIVAAGSKQPDLRVTVCTGEPESRDGPNRLAGLKQQLLNAVAVLRGYGAAPGDGIIVSIHSDSGTYSHVFGCYDTAGSQLAMTVAVPVAAVFGVTAKPLRLAGYLFDQMRGEYKAALIEDGSHQNAHDVDLLTNHTAEIAEAVVKGAMEYFGIPYQAEAPVEEDRPYFSVHGIPCNPEAALFKFWRAQRVAGANMGPAISGEMDGEPYGEAGSIVQKFENAIVVCKPAEDWACYRAQVVMQPERWLR